MNFHEAGSYWRWLWLYCSCFICKHIFLWFYFCQWNCGLYVAVAIELLRLAKSILFNTNVLLIFYRFCWINLLLLVTAILVIFFTLRILFLLCVIVESEFSLVHFDLFLSLIKFLAWFQKQSLKLLYPWLILQHFFLSLSQFFLWHININFYFC